jgi:hypothetical protein
MQLEAKKYLFIIKQVGKINLSRIGPGLRVPDCADCGLSRIADSDCGLVPIW